MKTFAICALVGGGVFFAALLSMTGLNFSPGRPAAQPKIEKKDPPKAKFPETLAPAARAKPVEQAAAFKPSSEPHKITVMTPAGALHPWHEYFPEAWQADYVEETELVIVVGQQRKQVVQHITYANNAPPIDRYLFEVEISVVEAKTGNILDNRMFRNLPRAVRQSEAWERTSIGSVVAWSTVYQWVAEKCKTGFPDEKNPTPVETVVD